MKLTKTKLKELADDVTTGLRVYLNPNTLEHTCILFDDMDDVHEAYEDEMNKVKSWDKSIEIESMDSNRLFRAMEDFAYTVKDSHLQDKLLTILSLRSPVYNFKEIVKSSNERENWYKYILKVEMEYIRSQLEIEDIEIEE